MGFQVFFSFPAGYSLLRSPLVLYLFPDAAAVSSKGLGWNMILLSAGGRRPAAEVTFGRGLLSLVTEFLEPWGRGMKMRNFWNVYFIVDRVPIFLRRCSFYLQT
jgi:hypothetical protein